jgi:hypothetical protein
LPRGNNRGALVIHAVPLAAGERANTFTSINK